jgi:hypothetical protein
VLPLDYGLNVNMPYITSFDNDTCINPPFIHTRLTGDAWSYGVKFNASTGIFTAGLKVGPYATGINVCINGDCGLIGETALIAKGYYSAVSVFTVDYDAPSCSAGAVDETKLLGSLVQNMNSTTLVRWLNATTTAKSIGSASTLSVTAVVTNDAGPSVRSSAAAVSCLAVAILLLL